MKSQNNGKNDKGALSNGNNSGKADKWKAPVGPGLPSSLQEIEKTLGEVKLENGKPFPLGLIERAKTAFKDCLKLPRLNKEKLWLGRELWEVEIKQGLLSVNPDTERAEALVDAILSHFPGGKDFQNAVKFREKFETLPFKLQNYLTFCGTSKEEVLRLSELKETESGENLVSDNWLDLCVNCSGTFGNLKKFYTFTEELSAWETVHENRERRKEDEGDEKSKVAKVASLPVSVSEDESF